MMRDRRDSPPRSHRVEALKAVKPLVFGIEAKKRVKKLGSPQPLLKVSTCFQIAK